MLSHVSGLVAGAQCCVNNSRKVWHHLGEQRAKNVLFCACMALPLWHWATLAGTGSVQSLKIVRKVKKKSGQKHLVCDKVSDFITDFIT